MKWGKLYKVTLIEEGNITDLHFDTIDTDSMRNFIEISQSSSTHYFYFFQSGTEVSNVASVLKAPADEFGNDVSIE